jgi:uncharacterized membrane protein YagU involved in acid resistance
VRMDIAGSLAGMLHLPWVAGLMMHFVNGAVIFPLIYGLALYGSLRGGSALRGMAFGAILWLVAQLVVMPMIGAGVFSSKMGGMAAVGASLMAHLVYGALLGSIGGTGAAIVPRVSATEA